MKAFWVLLLYKNDGARFQKQLQYGSNWLAGLTENDKHLERKLTDKNHRLHSFALNGSQYCTLQRVRGKKKNQEVVRDWQWAALIQQEFKKQTNKSRKKMSFYRCIAFCWILSQISRFNSLAVPGNHSYENFLVWLLLIFFLLKL